MTQTIYDTIKAEDHKLLLAILETSEIDVSCSYPQSCCTQYFNTTTMNITPYDFPLTDVAAFTKKPLQDVKAMLCAYPWNQLISYVGIDHTGSQETELYRIKAEHVRPLREKLEQIQQTLPPVLPRPHDHYDFRSVEYLLQKSRESENEKLPLLDAARQRLDETVALLKEAHLLGILIITNKLQDTIDEWDQILSAERETLLDQHGGTQPQTARKLKM